MEPELIALLTVISSVIVAIVGIVSILFTFFSIRQQQEHNRKSVQPLCNVGSSMIKSKVSLTLKNVGNGPMIIKGFKYLDESEKSSNNIRDFMPEGKLPSGTIWVAPADDRVLELNGTINLLLFQKKESMDEEQYKNDRKWLLKAIAGLKIFVEYESLYGEKFSYVKDLSFIYSILERESEGELVGDEDAGFEESETNDILHE